MLIRLDTSGIYGLGVEVNFTLTLANQIEMTNHASSISRLEVLRVMGVIGNDYIGGIGFVDGLVSLRSIVCGGLELDRDYSFNMDFHHGGSSYYYEFEVCDGLVVEDGLYMSGLGAADDRLIYSRALDKSKNLALELSEEVSCELSEAEIASLHRGSDLWLSGPFLLHIASLHGCRVVGLADALAWFTAIEIHNGGGHLFKAGYIADVAFRRYANELISNIGIGVDRTYIEDGEIGFVGGSGLHTYASLSEEVNRILEYIWLVYRASEHGGLHLVSGMDGGIHPLVLRRLLSSYMESAGGGGGQLAFTFRDSSIMDQGIFRRDELWIFGDGLDLYSICEFKDMRSDMNLGQMYTSGRFGGIPCGLCM